MPGTPMPWVKPQFFDDDGEVAAGYQLFVYDAGTVVKQDTWQDSGLSVLNTNPIVLDSEGRANIFLTAQTHRFKLATPTAADPPAAGDTIWDVDDIPSTSFWELDPNVNRIGTRLAIALDETKARVTAPYTPVILQNYYSGAATMSADVDIPAGTLWSTAARYALVLEWEVDYGAANLAARAEICGTNIDLGAGANATHCRSQYIVYPSSAATVEVSQIVFQDTGGGNPQHTCDQDQIAALDLEGTDYTVSMGMNGGTYTIRGARVYLVKILANLLG